MFNAIFNLVCNVIYKAANIVKSLVCNDWTKNAEQASGYDHDVITASKNSVNWVRWFKGEYRMAYNAQGFDSSRNILAGLVVSVIFGVIGVNFFMGWPVIVGMPLALGMAFVGAKLGQAIDLKFQLTEMLQTADAPSAAV